MLPCLPAPLKVQMEKLRAQQMLVADVLFLVKHEKFERVSVWRVRHSTKR